MRAWGPRTKIVGTLPELDLAGNSLNMTCPLRKLSHCRGVVNFVRTGSDHKNSKLVLVNLAYSVTSNQESRIRETLSLLIQMASSARKTRKPWSSCYAAEVGDASIFLRKISTFSVCDIREKSKLRRRSQDIQVVRIQSEWNILIRVTTPRWQGGVFLKVRQMI